MNSSMVLQANVVRSQFCTYLSRQHFKMISTNVKYAQPLVLSSSALCSSILFQENNIINENSITRRLPPNPNNMQQYKMISTNFNSPILKDKPPITTTTYTPSASEKSGGISWFSRTIKQFVDKKSRKNIRAAGFVYYSICTANVRNGDFIDYFDMDDTFISWFLITELHIWMLCNRVMAVNNHDGTELRDVIIISLWNDCDQRMKKIGGMASGKGRKAQLTSLNEQFQASMLIYDCGIMGNDQELASALWRRFFLMNQPDGPRIELLVKYVRHCMNMLDDIPNEHYYIGRRIDWPSLDEINALK